MRRDEPPEAIGFWWLQLILCGAKALFSVQTQRFEYKQHELRDSHHNKPQYVSSLETQGIHQLNLGRDLEKIVKVSEAFTLSRKQQGT